MKKIILTIVLFPFLFASTTFAAKPAGPRVLPVNGNPFGQLYSEWAADFARWTYSIPYDLNPMVSGHFNCTQPQNGKVWFVGTATNTSQTPDPNDQVVCEVPEGKAIFLQLGAYIDTYPCPDPNFGPAPGQKLVDFLTNDAQWIVSNYIPPNGLNIDSNLVVVDGAKQHVTSKLFTLKGDLSLLNNKFDTCITGKPQKAVADGSWAMIVDLPLGQHTFSFTDGTTMNVNIIHQ